MIELLTRGKRQYLLYTGFDAFRMGRSRRGAKRGPGVLVTAWYFEPLNHAGPYLFSDAYPTREQALEAIGDCEERGVET